MKKTILAITFFILHFTLLPLWGQGGLDSLHFSQESGTLQKQRFIDQYDYVFMTKEQTTFMAKLGYNPPASPLFGVTLGLEKKLDALFSIGGGLYAGHDPSNNLGYWLEIRSYYDMVKRIEEGTSANNFSGNYISFIVIQNIRQKYNNDYFAYHYLDKDPTYYINNDFKGFYGVRWGMQRRFFNNGFIDLSINVGAQVYKTDLFQTQEFLIQTDLKLGLAIGDFKKSAKPPLCDVLMCYEKRVKMLKIAWPSIQIGAKRQKIAASIAYEQRIKNTPVSINLQSGILLSHIDDGIWLVRNINDSTRYDKINVQQYFASVESSIQLRRYINFSKNEIMNLSGLYFGLSLANDLIHLRSIFTNSTYTKITVGPMVGFQQKVFSNGYIDFNLNYSYPLYEKVNGYDYSNGKILKAQLALGFAF